MTVHNQTAPGDLEEVRRFINTWSIPNQTRLETDLLPVLVTDPQAWQRDVSTYPLEHGDDLNALFALRSDLRSTCADHSSDRKALNPWFANNPLCAHVALKDGCTHIQLKPVQSTYAGYVLAIVANAIARDTWSRLKTCDDCQWAFYDHTRNGKKRWCGMTKGGPDGRACGTIAKVRAFRTRQGEKSTK